MPASASHAYQSASASASSHQYAAAPPPLHQCLCCPPPPQPMLIDSHHWPVVRDELCSGEVELRGLSVRANWYDGHAWICVNVQEAMVVTHGHTYQCPKAHITLPTVSFKPVLDSHHMRTAEAARDHCAKTYSAGGLHITRSCARSFGVDWPYG